MLTILVGKNTYGLQYGTYSVGGDKYLVDHNGIVAQNNFGITRVLYTDNRVCGISEDQKILHTIEVNGLARGQGTRL